MKPSLEDHCMVDELRRPGTMPRPAQPGSWPALVAPAALIRRLERLRERVLERLDSLETIARAESTSPCATGATADLQQDLEQKLADLEATERRLHAEAERREHEWSASLTQLEADRRLLAEAWERIERERMAYASGAAPVQRGHDHARTPESRIPATLPPAGALVTARPASAESEPNHPVAQAILRQFQTLCSDVRRNAEERRGSL
jgi:hypothetical protein